MEQLYMEDPEEKLLAAFFAAADFIRDEKMEEEAYVDYEKGKNLNPWVINKRLK